MGSIVLDTTVSIDPILGAQRDDARRKRRAWRWKTGVTALALALAAGYAWRYVTREPPDVAAYLAADPADVKRWAEAAAAYANAREPEREAACFGVARLLEPTEPAWRNRPVDRVPALVEALPIGDVAWLRRIAHSADQQQEFAVSGRLYQLARRHAPADRELGLAVERTGAFAAAKSDYRSANSWRAAAAALRAEGDAAAAEAFEAVVILLQPTSEPIRRPFDGSRAPEAIRRIGISDAGWIGRLGQNAESRREWAGAAAMYEAASTLAGADEAGWKSRASIARLRGQLLSSPSNDELWGDLGDVYAGRGDARANGAYGVAWLLDGSDREWSQKTTNVNIVASLADVLRGLPMTDDEWVGRLGDVARRRNHADAALALYGFAAELDPAAEEWRRHMAALRREGTTPVDVVDHGPVTGPAPATESDPPAPEPSAPMPEPAPPAPVVATPPAPATLAIRAPYPVLLKIGNESRGVSTTHQAQVGAGRHTVTVEAAQVFYRSIQDITAAPGATISIGPPAVVRIQVAAVPANARLYIDGWYARMLPGTIEITTGRHEFEFQWPALERRNRQTVDVLQDGQHVIGALR